MRSQIFKPLFKPLYWSLRAWVAVFVTLKEYGSRFGHILLQSEYEIKTGCKKRGVCCEFILFEWSELFDKYPWLGRIALFKSTRFYRFFDRGYAWELEDGTLVRVLGCHALRKDGLCGEYFFRPSICRTYPLLPLLGKPATMKGCGYTYKKRHGLIDEEELVGEEVPDDRDDTDCTDGSSLSFSPETLVRIGGLRGASSKRSSGPKSS